MPEAPQGSKTGGEETGGQQQQGQSSNQPTNQPQQGQFTQADVDRIVADRLKREQVKYADYDDLKKAANAQRSAEDRIADLEKTVVASQQEALRRRVQATHKISDEDADLFLTGTDEQTLTAQAKRLADRDAAQARKGSVIPGEGHTPSDPSNTDPKRELVRSLFHRND